MRQRDALVAALIGQPRGLPGPENLDLRPFWRSFSRHAPPHLRLGFGAATATLAYVLPRAWGYGASLADLSPSEQEQLVARAHASRALAPLVDVAKVVACFAYFDDDAVDRAVRRTS